MSKKKSKQAKSTARQAGLKPADKSFNSNQMHNQNRQRKTGLIVNLKKHWWLTALIVFLSVSVFAGGLKYLEEDARRQLAANQQNPANHNRQSLLSRINPFLANPLPTNTPQLAKEYIYAGSRMLAVEDAATIVAPPADLAIWRPSSGYWWVMSSAYSQQAGVGWGANGDRTVAGDYDGDGKTDFAVFRPTDNTWYVLKSSDNNYFGVTFGLNTDKLVPADYDGDGKTDIAVYRPSDATWYIARSSDGGITYHQFGVSTDTPVPADYDGDGKTDVAVWRDSTTAFYSLNTSNGQLSGTTFGQSGDVPAVGDYDGDGKADVALRSGNNWIIKYSSSAQTQTISWEQSTDVAVQHDYDGDGKTDIAVWRASNGNWYIRNSSTGLLRQEQWGMAGDTPVPGIWRR